MKKALIILLLLLPVTIAAQVKHSLAQWSFRVPMSYLLEQAKPLGITGIEIIDESKWDRVKGMGYDIIVADGADLGIDRGFADPVYADELVKRYKTYIPKVAAAGIPYLICYSGLNVDRTPEEALETCVSALKQLMPSAEKNGVILLMELYSSKDGKDLYFKQSFPHYAADNIEWGVELCKKVGSPNLRLLYDAWQMNDMGADIFEDVRKYHDYIAHYHVSGVDRKPFSDNEPVDWKEFARTIYSTGYKGYVGHEYMIEKEVPKKLKEAVDLLSYEVAQLPFELQNWGDSLCYYASFNYLPATKYRWNWREATLLRGFMNIYESQPEKREAMMDYIRTAMKSTMEKAHASHPNAVASCVGLAFLARQGKGEEYMRKATEMYEQYIKIPRASNGGVSHRANVIELWDDTVYMIGLFLIEMYRATNDVTYLDELCFQISAHAEKLADTQTGLWYHGWDNDNIDTDDRCCQLGWADNPQRRNNEFWGRGNGWIAMALADLLEVLPNKHADRKKMQSLYAQMMSTLSKLQDTTTGHWLQLPVHTGDTGKGNFIDSSCTAMFGYAMAKGIRLKILSEKYKPIVANAHNGIGRYSIEQTGNYLTLSNVCAGTCIGDKDYYYRRSVVSGTEFGLGAALLFDNEYKLIE